MVGRKKKYSSSSCDRSGSGRDSDCDGGGVYYSSIVVLVIINVRVCICSTPLNANHAMTCKSGVFVYMRHDEVREMETNIERNMSWCGGTNPDTNIAR